MTAPGVAATDYDRSIMSRSIRRLFDGTGFYNIGYWLAADGAPLDALGEACRRLVEEHVARDDADRRASARTVLDVGCGLGATTAVLAPAYPSAHLVGINYSERQLGEAAARAPGTPFIAADATRLPVKDACVDTLHCIEAAMHFAPRAAFLSEAARVLVPGGRMVISDFLAAEPNDVVSADNVVPDAGAYAALCEEAGLTVVDLADITDATLAPFNAHLSSRSMEPIARYMAGVADRYIIAVLEHR